MKRYLKIIIIIFILAAIGAATYYFFRRNPEIQQAIVNLFPGSQKIDEQPSVEEPALPKLDLLTTTTIFDYWINSKTGDIYYLNEIGQVIRRSDENEEIINSQTINRLNKIMASSDGSAIIAKFNYPNSPIFSIFDVTTSGWQPLPAGTIATAWSPDSQKIAYLDNRSLKILDLSNQQTEEIIKLSQKDLFLDWHNDSGIWLISNPGTRTKVFSLNLNQKTLTPILEEVGLVISWSEDGQLGIKLDTTNGDPITSLIDNTGDVLAQFSFITLPSKCLIEENKIYCAIPKNIKEATKLPDDYFKRATYFDDTLYIIDLSTTEVSELATENIEFVFDAEHLEIHNGRLYFKNRLDNGLYSLRIE